tara:strand:+ start:384 stop:632 length:249 start_codon:yes stop_codon:yes gene_type:complete
MQIVRLETAGLVDALATTVTDVRRALESVRTDTTEPGCWRPKPFGDMAVSLGNGWVDESAAKEGIEATKAYEKKLIIKALTI